eukprot:3665599-Amphidinium_carterae.1
MLGIADRSRPDASEWREAVMRQGPQGGFGAPVALDAEDAIRFVRQQAPAPLPGFADDAWITVEQLVRGIQLYDRIGECTWVEREWIYAMLLASTLLPNLLLQHGHSLMHPQVRFSEVTHETHIFTEVPTRLLTQAIMIASLSVQWLSRAMAKTVWMDVASCMAFPQVGKALMTCAFEEVCGDVPPYAYGAVRGPTGEEALSIQLILEYRCRKARLCSVLCLYDISNAFPSMCIAELAKVIADEIDANLNREKVNLPMIPRRWQVKPCQVGEPVKAVTQLHYMTPERGVAAEIHA